MSKFALPLIIATCIAFPASALARSGGEQPPVVVPNPPGQPIAKDRANQAVNALADVLVKLRKDSHKECRKNPIQIKYTGKSGSNIYNFTWWFGNRMGCRGDATVEDRGRKGFEVRIRHTK